MKTINLSAGRRAADLDALFGGTHTIALRKAEPLDGGKYQWTGRASDYAGKPVSVPDDVTAAWVVRRVDADGPYAFIMCV